MFLSEGDDFDGFGSCDGDSGGPVAVLEDSDLPHRFMQVGLVQGGVGACGDRDMPGIYVRLKDPEILNFIYETLGKSASTSRLTVTCLCMTHAV